MYVFGVRARVCVLMFLGAAYVQFIFLRGSMSKAVHVRTCIVALTCTVRMCMDRYKYNLRVI